MAQGDVSSPLLPQMRHETLSQNTTWAGEPAGDGSPEKTASVAASSLNLSACALGASMLSLPYALSISGPVIGLECLVLLGVMAYFAAQAIIRAGIVSHRSNYAAIVHHFFGHLAGSVVEALLAIALAVAAISYIVGLADLLPDILPFTALLSRTPRMLVTVVLLYPITLIGSLAVFGPASAFAVAGCYILAVSLSHYRR